MFSTVYIFYPINEDVFKKRVKAAIHVLATLYATYVAAVITSDVPAAAAAADKGTGHYGAASAAAAPIHH